MSDMVGSPRNGVSRDAAPIAEALFVSSYAVSQVFCATGREASVLLVFQ